jgi:hypothetical protein
MFYQEDERVRCFHQAQSTRLPRYGHPFDRKREGKNQACSLTPEEIVIREIFRPLHRRHADHPVIVH